MHIKSKLQAWNKHQNTLADVVFSYIIWYFKTYNILDENFIKKKIFLTKPILNQICST